MRTTYDPKPIPVRKFDWSATASDYEPGDPIGYGATEVEALADLREQIKDRDAENGSGASQPGSGGGE